jgi:4-carboxymuconolactone decarboxylase/3-oxoadipate enol-lactonase/4-carboxymuconolactone decarboxylase
VDDDDRRREGERIRREVLGDDHVDRATTTAAPQSRDFQDFITRVAWGDVWARPGLDRRTRSCLTVALLAALGHWDELGLHVRAAVRNGLTREDIAEVLMHTSVYAGVPVANHGLSVAWRALDEADGATAAT